MKLQFNSYNKRFENLNELDVYKHYLGVLLSNTPFCSPFRYDTKPSCTISEYKGRLWFKDFGQYTNIPLTEFICKVYNTNLSTAIQYTIEEMLEGINHSDKYTITKQDRLVDEFIVHTSTESPDISVVFREWNEIDLNYWNLPLYYLKSHQIYPIKKVYYGESLQPNLTHTATNPTYGYFYNENKWKIYKPKSLDNKWRGNVNKDTVDKDYNEYPKYILCTSKKDRITLLYILEKLGIYNIGTISYQSESSVPIINYPLLAVIGDNDNAGRIFTEKIKAKYHCKIITLSCYKDIFEYFINNRKQLIKELQIKLK